MNLLCLATYFSLALKGLDGSRIQKKNRMIKVTGDHTKKGRLGLYLSPVDPYKQQLAETENQQY